MNRTRTTTNYNREHNKKVSNWTTEEEKRDRQRFEAQHFLMTSHSVSQPEKEGVRGEMT